MHLEISNEIYFDFDIYTAVYSILLGILRLFLNASLTILNLYLRNTKVTIIKVWQKLIRKIVEKKVFYFAFFFKKFILTVFAITY